MLRWLSTLALLTLQWVQLTTLATQVAQGQALSLEGLSASAQANDALGGMTTAQARGAWSLRDASLRDASLRDASLRDGVLHDGPLRDTLPPARDDELPWCSASDDPRCAPLENTTHNTQHERLVTPALQADQPQPSAHAIQVAGFFAHSGVSAHPGIATRVERPPRTR